MKIKLLILSLLIIFVSTGYLLWGYGVDIPGKIFFLRLNVILQGFLVSSILSLGGYILQILLANPLAEPYLIGVSGASCFGATMAVFFNLSPLFVFRSVCAIFTGILVTLLIIILSIRKKFFSVVVAILLGVAFNSFFSSLIILFQSFLLPNDFYSSVRWIMGNFEYLTFNEMALLFLAFLMIFFYCVVFKKELFIYQSGEEMALTVGVETNKLKVFGFIIVAFSTSISVSLSGMIGFIGLIIPHIARMIFSRSKENIVFFLLLLGFLIISISIFLSRNLIPGTILPVGVISSLIGVPFFIYILLSMGMKHFG